MVRIVGSSIFKFSVIIFPIVFLVFGISGFVSTPFYFIQLELGKLIDPFYSTSILAGILVSTFLVIFFLFYRYSPIKTSHPQSHKKDLLIVISSVGLCLVLLVLLSGVFLAQVSTGEIDTFVSEKQGETLENLVNQLPIFRKTYVQGSYGTLGEYLEIDNHICYSVIDCTVMDILGVSRADLILYQGWGSCGQAAVVNEQILHELGYETRRAKFIGRDHEWAEVKNPEGKWQIVDPDYITQSRSLMDIEELGTDTRFQDATGVEVMYRNGTIMDMSKEHGY